ncbi:MAG: hypothetical protein AAB510_02880, partial [Patescibacteria group bacterium]
DFQSANGINPTGYVGPVTKAKIRGVDCGVLSSIPNTPSVLGASQINNNIIFMKESTPGEFFYKFDNYYNLNPENILKNFYSKNADVYDFLAVFSAKSLIADQSIMINNFGETIGGHNNIPGNFKSPSKKLKSLVYWDISGPDIVSKSGVSLEDFEKQNLKTKLTSFSHEIAHHWVAYINWPGMKNPHYGNMVDLFNGSLSYADPMGYHHWVSTASGIVCVDNNSATVTQKFSDLSLYLMGLIPKTSVKPISVIQTAVNYPYGPQCDEPTNFLGIKTYTINDIIKLAGSDRMPTYPNTQKDFKIGYIFVVPANETPSAISINFASNVVNQLPKFWSDLTGNLSQLISSTSNPLSNLAPYITNETVSGVRRIGIQGYDSITGKYSNNEAVAGKYLILYGNFASTGNKVGVGTKDYTPKYESTSQLNVLLDSTITGNLQVIVKNGTKKSNVLNFKVVGI